MWVPLAGTIAASAELASPEKVAFNAGKDSSAPRNGLQEKIVDGGWSARRSARLLPRAIAWSEVQSTARSTMNCGTVALLNVIERARARRMLG